MSRPEFQISEKKNVNIFEKYNFLIFLLFRFGRVRWGKFFSSIEKKVSLFLNPLYNKYYLRFNKILYRVIIS